MFKVETPTRPGWNFRRVEYAVRIEVNSAATDGHRQVQVPVGLKHPVQTVEALEVA
jgi:hypothetical protein